MKGSGPTVVESGSSYAVRDLTRGTEVRTFEVK